MSVAREKKFVLKQVFKNLKNAGLTSSGDIKEHFGIPWKLHVLYGNTLYLECLHSEKLNSWCLEVDIELSLGNEKDVKLEEKTIKFASSNLTKIVFEMENYLDKYLIDGNLIVELVVKINKSMGIRYRLKELSDVILIAGDRKFYVNRMYISCHSSYFKTILLGKLSESEKSIIELKNIDPDDLQKFLNVLYGESEINYDTVEGILKLAVIYDAKTVIGRCEEFLLEKSKSSMKIKFTWAVRYKLDASLVIGFQSDSRKFPTRFGKIPEQKWLDLVGKSAESGWTFTRSGWKNERSVVLRFAYSEPVI
ncbi:hypothetical protein B9Z55_007933 [Caenorhabditis nigoni]|uniref:BTB domain-containing protein n=1 Tax=Caenorhabditis nigoni TaxID=1611254 RepID=A0A2G5VBV1_9PELO|nr:hypothetical protein B9Z55_007933 [Caenorhabditis nigoni]